MSYFLVVLGKVSYFWACEFVLRPTFLRWKFRGRPENSSANKQYVKKIPSDAYNVRDIEAGWSRSQGASVLQIISVSTRIVLSDV